MKAFTVACFVAVLGLAACNANPLLQEAAADYAAIRVGSTWSYRSPDGLSTLVRTVTGASTYQGRDAFSVVETGTGTFGSSTYYLSIDRGAWQVWDNSLGWIIQRRVPYIVGNSWTVPSNNPNVSIVVDVAVAENVTVPAGQFNACFKLRTDTSTVSGGVTTTASTLAWAAGDVGDVQYGALDTNGTPFVTLQLESYHIP